MSKPNNKQSQRLVTLRVSKISFDAPSIDQLTKSDVAPVYVEATHQDAKQLAEYLLGRVAKGVPGAIGFQLHGRLVLG